MITNAARQKEKKRGCTTTNYKRINLASRRDVGKETSATPHGHVQTNSRNRATALKKSSVLGWPTRTTDDDDAIITAAGWPLYTYECSICPCMARPGQPATTMTKNRKAHTEDDDNMWGEEEEQEGDVVDEGVYRVTTGSLRTLLLVTISQTIWWCT